MKSHKNIFEEICSFENLYQSYLKARKCKRYKDYILDFSWNVEEELLALQAELKNKTYQHGEYYEFTLYDAKKREIKAAPFRDRVVHHALCNVIEPLFDKKFIYDSYACRKGKGTHKAVKRFEQFLKSSEDKWKGKEVYCLKCDVSKYFDSIDHEILLSLIGRVVKDDDAMWLIKIIVKSSFKHRLHSYDLFHYRDTGIPIGNLTSQLFANLYLNELDQFVKHSLQKKYYLRYMDDFLLLGDDKRELHGCENVLRKFLSEELKLELHKRKVSLAPVGEGVFFLGYRIFQGYKLVRKTTVKRFLANMQLKVVDGEDLADSIRSWLSFANNTSNFSLKQMLVKRFDYNIFAI
jgi:RNA-directed DNA polymerase